MKVPSLHPSAAPGSPEAIEAARALSRKLYSIYTEISVAMLISGASLFFLSLEMTRHQVLVGLGISTATYLLMIPLDLVVIARHFRPLGRFLRGEAPDTAAAVTMHALNLPLLAFIRVLLIHFPTFVFGSTVGILVANRWLEFGFRGWQYGALLLLTVFLGSLHAVYEYFQVVRAVRPVIPMIRRNVGPGAQSAVVPTRVSMRQKLIVSSTLAGVIPLVVLGGTTVFKAGYLYELMGSNAVHDLSRLWIWVAWLALGSGTVVLVMSHVLAKDVSAPAQELAEAMRRVGTGELGMRMDITSTDEFAELFGGFNQMTQGLEERERLREAFGRYVGPIAEEVLKNGASLGGETAHATILFADIRSFTSLSEQMKPAQVVALLNGYFAAVEPELQAEGGWINKFGGDSLLAVFGAPVAYPDHPARAVRAALRIREALRRFNERQRAIGMPELAIGIGLHSGDVLAGNVGSPTRLEYTVIGDVVNVAARLQALTKDHGTDIIASRQTLEASGLSLPTRELPVTNVRGKSEVLQIFSLEREVQARSA